LIKKTNGAYGFGVYGTTKPPQSNCETLLKIKKSFDSSNVTKNDLLVCNHQTSSQVACYVRIPICDLKSNLKLPDLESKPDVLLYQADSLDLTKCFEKIQFGMRKKCR
jgi:hypothetical protein